ncbi:MAG: hypothetical protein LBI53_08200 [Candidatus Peribacteria bacterium]|jgi:hypothetical protein|nr:hypothetical protein [Candidatus Peribacteria bacterium]
MKDHLGTPFKQRNTAIQEYGNDRSDLVNKDQDTSSRITELDISIEAQNQQIINGTASPETIRKQLSEYYNRVKIFTERNILSERNNSSLLTISTNQDVGPVKIEISGTGDSCLVVDGKNLCQSPNIRTKTFNPQTHPQTGLLITLPSDRKAGSNLLNIKMCTPTASSKDCVTKTQKITINPGTLQTITIKPERTGDNSTVGGMMTVFEVKAFDKNKNPVDRSTETYTITTDTGQFLHEGRYTTGFKINNFKNLKFYYQAPENSINNSKAAIQALSDTGRVMTERKQILLEGLPQVSYGTYDSNGKLIPKNLDKKTFTGSIILTLPPTDTTHFIDNKGIRQLNKTFNQTGLQRLEIRIQNSSGKLISVDGKVTIYNKDNLINIGTIAEKEVLS